MSTIFQKTKVWVGAHKKTSIIIAIAILFGGYKVIAGTSSSITQVTYVTAVAEKGDIIASVSGTGQVAALNKVEMTSEVSGTISSIPARMGDVVKQGDIIVMIDAKDATRSVNNAYLSLQNAEMSYDKAYKQAQDQSVLSSISSLTQAYEDGHTSVSSTIVDIPDIISTLNSIFYRSDHSTYFSDPNVYSYAGQVGLDYKYDAGRTFDQARKDFDVVFDQYKTTSSSDRVALVTLIQNTYAVTKKMYAAVTGTYNTIDYVKQHITTGSIPTQITTDKTTLDTAISTLNSHLTSLANILKSIEDGKDTSLEATRSLKSAELSRDTAENDLRKAEEDLAKYTIRAPFDGVVGKISVENGNKISVGAAVATFVTQNKIAQISLNEVDVSKVKVGQKAVLTFDAVNGVSIMGTVTQIDLIGTVTQGVVNYTVTIAFDTDDDRVKIGMSLAASIISETKKDVVRVPNSAVKSQAGKNYVEVKNATGVAKVFVKTGLADDEYTEILSGLNEGDSFVARTTTTATAAKTTTSTPSLFGGSTRSFQGAGGVRTQTR